MVFFWRKAAVVTALLALPACSAAQRVVAPATATSTEQPEAKSPPIKHKHAASKPSAAELPATLPTPPPPTPEQMPANPPQVTYNDGLLSIVANNSTLSDILREVGVSTGATVDAPANLTRERVAARIGPGSPRAVLSDLLTGSHFDYILLGADGDPNAVTSIILSANQTSPAAAAAQPPTPMRASMPPQPEPDDEADDEPSPPPPAPIPEAPPAQPPRQASPGRPFVPQQPPDQVSGQPATSGEGGQQIRTPEQMLEQLRRMQQPGAQPNTPPNPPQ